MLDEGTRSKLWRSSRSRMNPNTVTVGLLSSSSEAASAISSSNSGELLASPLMDDTLSLDLQRHVGGYALGHVLGVGAFGEVRLGQNLETGAIVAVKIVAEAEGKASRLPNEIAILKRLKGHPNIAQLLDAVHDVPLRATWCRSCACTEFKAGERFDQCRSCSPHDRCDHSFEEVRPVTLLVLEPAMGGELFAVIKEAGSLPEPVARLFFIQLCSALRHCHSNGVAHRDLRLENLVIDHHLQLKMIDFGLAACADQDQDGTEGRPILLSKPPSGGQILYAAPETLFGDCLSTYLGEPADIWSLAVILFIMLTGRPPFRRPVGRYVNPAMRRCEHFVQLQTGNYPSSVSPSARELLIAMFEMDPSKRIRLEDITKHNWVSQGSVPDQRELYQFLHPNIAAIHTNQNKRCFSNVLRRLCEQDALSGYHGQITPRMLEDDEKSESSVALEQSSHLERADDARGL